MEEKNRYLFLEILFSFFLLEPVIFLFGDILSPYRLYFTLGLIGGFSFSWFNRNKQSSLIRIFINIGAVGVFIWIIYLLLNSSLLYREVILTFIKGGIILEVIFSFNSYYPPSLTYIQALSLPLLMCFPIFVKDYNEAHAILVLIYIICWIVILKIKFYKFLKPLKEKKVKQHLSIFISAILFLSDKDPYFVLPILMGVSMFIQQKMSPSASGDPATEKMMLLMPIIFTFMFFQFPSGLVLYWLIQNIVTVIEHWLIEKGIEK